MLKARGVPIVGIGKIGDIFVGKGLTESVHTEGNRDGMRAHARGARGVSKSGLVFTNLVEFDSHFGHRRDPAGWRARCASFDQDLAPLVEELRPGDRLIVSADHGNDPTFTKTTDHTREYVPLLVYAPGETGRALGVRGSFCDIGATVAEAFGARGAAGGAAAGCTTAGTALGGAMSDLLVDPAHEAVDEVERHCFELLAARIGNLVLPANVSVVRKDARRLPEAVEDLLIGEKEVGGDTVSESV